MPCEQCSSIPQSTSPSPSPTPPPGIFLDGGAGPYSDGGAGPYSDVGDTESTDSTGIHVHCNTLTDEQFNMLFSYTIANRVSGGANSTRSAFTMPPLPFVDAGEDNTKSLLDTFPLVSHETISEIIHFEFFHPNLYKLDPVSSESSKEYPTLVSLIGPLSIYFQILACYAAASNSTSAVLAIQRASASYSAHLASLNSTYEWSAVLQYHSRFFFRRSREMARGDFSGWCAPDNDLVGEVLLGHNRIQWAHTFKVYSILVVVLILQAWSMLGKHFY